MSEEKKTIIIKSDIELPNPPTSVEQGKVLLNESMKTLAENRDLTVYEEMKKSYKKAQDLCAKINQEEFEKKRELLTDEVKIATLSKQNIQLKKLLAQKTLEARSLEVIGNEYRTKLLGIADYVESIIPQLSTRCEIEKDNSGS